MAHDTITLAESRDFRRLRRIFAWMMPGVFAVFLLGRYIESSWPASLVGFAYIVGFLYFAAFATVGVQVLFWRCPRCGRFFSIQFWPRGVAWPFVDNCVHCNSALAKDGALQDL